MNPKDFVDALRKVIVETLIPEIRELREDTNRKFEAIQKQMDERFTAIQKQMDERFAKVDERFAKIDERFTKADEKFEKLFIALAKIDERTAMMVEIMKDLKKVERLEVRLDNLEQKFEKLSKVA
ncbi:MAG: hypothetical protein AB1765_07700 [Candidatus Hydrogenedentota bacterium]